MNFRFAHISDLHLPPLPAVSVHEILNKRLLGYLSWHRKRKFRHQTEVITALTRDLAGGGLDCICITGDVTNLGLPGEFQAANRWLDTIMPRNAITFVPGNHDAYVTASIRAMHENFAPWVRNGFPFVHRHDGVLFIGISTAVATPPLLASGRVGPEQLNRLETLLDKTAHDDDLFQILLMHHPPVEGVVPRRKALVDTDALREVLYRRRVDLILHGHGHHPARCELESRNGPIPVFGAGSTSLSHRDTARTGHYHVFNLTAREVSVRHCFYRPAQQRFVSAKEEVLPRATTHNARSRTHH